MNNTSMNNTYTKDEDTMVLAWTSLDIIEHARDGMDIELTIEQARQVLRKLEDTYDSEFGINWHSITCAIETITDINQ